VLPGVCGGWGVICGGPGVGLGLDSITMVGLPLCGDSVRVFVEGGTVKVVGVALGVLFAVLVVGLYLCLCWGW